MRTLKERFNERFVKQNNGCWLWTAGKIGKYGSIKNGEKREVSHRISWKIYKGEIPTGMFVCHRCDVTLCVNPEHLFLGTQKDNIVDAVSKNRMAKGEEPGSAKLKEKQVIELLKNYTGKLGEQVFYARTFGVGRCVIWRIINGITWRYLMKQYGTM